MSDSYPKDITIEELKRRHTSTYRGTSQIEIEALVATMNNAAAILAECMLKQPDEYKQHPDFNTGGDDTHYDYIPNGLGVVRAIIDIWDNRTEPKDFANWDQIGRGDEVFFQDATPDEAIPVLKEVLEKAGYAVDSWADDTK